MAMTNKILILFAHPALEKSRVNKILIQGLDKTDNITFHDLYEAYPDMDIDVKKEQSLLENHDVIIFMHPLYWYSTPAILKEWQDLVLLHGWAYGSQGHALDGKILLNIITTGGPKSAYEHHDPKRFTLRQLLAPIEQTARLCGMKFQKPYPVYGTHAISPKEITAIKDKLDRFLNELIKTPK